MQKCQRKYIQILRVNIIFKYFKSINTNNSIDRNF